VTPDDAMMAVAERLAQSVEQGDVSLLDGLFARGDVTIVENFPPHVFSGQDGVRSWAMLMRRRVENIVQLRHVFGRPQDFTRSETGVYFSLPTRWSGVQDGHPFTELGAWGFLLVEQNGGWRIRAYSWGLVSFAEQHGGDQ
jgi:hypothetical protein